MRRYFLFLIQAACLTTAAVFSAAAQSEVSISAIQGSKARSPLENQVVKTIGIVTARDDNGYFMQTPDEKTDKDPATSEGIHVFVGQNGTFTGAIGDLVETTGTVVEFMPRAEKLGFTVTELTRATTRIVSSKNALPAPVTLTTAELLPNDLSALEKFEGMRVRAESLTVPWEERLAGRLFRYAVRRAAPDA